MADVILFDIIDAQITACGFLGGMVHAFRAEKATPWEIVGSIVVGALAANFIAPQVLKIITLLPVGFVHFVAFGIGMSGKHLCQVLELIFNGLLGKTENE